MATPEPLFIAAQDQKTSPALRSVSRKERQLLRTITELGDTVFSQEPQKTFQRRWPIGHVSEMVGMSRQMIRLREKEEKLPQPEKQSNGRYAGYTLEQINHIRDYFGTRPHRAQTDQPMVLSFSTLKGDFGKTALAVHLSQYLAMRGYRILFIDACPQANASALFGLNTDLEVLHWHHEAAQYSGDDEQQPLNYTLDEYLSRDFREFTNAIRASYFPGIDLVPASTALARVEYDLASVSKADPDRLNDLQKGIKSVEENYDVIIIDSSPNLGPLSQYAQRAATALAIPMQPTPGDVASTATFLSVLRGNLTGLSPKNERPHYQFETLVVNNLDEDKATHLEIAETLRTRLASEDLISAMMTDTSELDFARKEMRTLYDQAAPNRANDPHALAVRYLDRVNEELEVRIRRTWPSHQQNLLKEARI